MPQTIVLTGGGTGGHIFPGLALAESFANRGISLRWVGSRGMEKHLLQNYPHIRYHQIFAGKLHRRLTPALFLEGLKVLGGFIGALALLLRKRPAVVVALGGYVSTPVIVAAALLKIPTCTHESGITPGLATRLNASFSRKIFVAYRETLAQFKEPHRRRCTVVGTPVRSAIAQGDPVRGKRSLGAPIDLPLILFMGGSSGAQQINNLVYPLLEDLTQHYFVVHQHGEQANQGPKGSRKNYLPLPFVKDLSDILAAADLVVSRAGAGIVWELAAAQKPSVLIPLTQNTRGDQKENALFFQKLGASLLLNDPEPAALLREIRALMRNPQKRKAMSRAAALLDADGAAERMAHEIIKITKGGAFTDGSH